MSRFITLVIFLRSHLLVQIGSVTDTVFPNSSFSPGDFQNVPLFHNKQSPVQEKTENTVRGEENAASPENEPATFFLVQLKDA